MKKILSLIVFAALALVANAQRFTMPLWGDDMPNYWPSDQEEIVDDSQDIIKIRQVNHPTIEVFLPSERMRTGQAVVICPGGGYAMIAYDFEGTDVAKWFNSKGVVAVVLKYRLPQAASNVVSYKSPLLDAQRALRLVRSSAQEWGVDAARVGVMGFSAGGHLAATASTHYATKFAEPVDDVDLLSARPDFSILVYPVVTFRDDYTDNGTRTRLCNSQVTSELIDEFSNELHVDSLTPPTFLMHSSNDNIVPVQNSLQYYQRLVESGVEAEMHIYPIGGHGYSLAYSDPYLTTWTERLEAWLKRH
ncbi:MAG: alpha/beta hydrolase [Rikenellaceae bacterium]